MHVHLAFASSSTAIMESTFIVSLLIIPSRELFGLIPPPPLPNRNSWSGSHMAIKGLVLRSDLSLEISSEPT